MLSGEDWGDQSLWRGIPVHQRLTISLKSEGYMQIPALHWYLCDPGEVTQPSCGSVDHLKIRMMRILTSKHFGEDPVMDASHLETLRLRIVPGFWWTFSTYDLLFPAVGTALLRAGVPTDHAALDTEFFWCSTSGTCVALQSQRTILMWIFVSHLPPFLP